MARRGLYGVQPLLPSHISVRLSPYRMNGHLDAWKGHVSLWATVHSGTVDRRVLRGGVLSLGVRARQRLQRVTLKRARPETYFAGHTGKASDRRAPL